MRNHVEHDDVVINDKKRTVPHEVVHGGSSKYDVGVVRHSEGVSSTAVRQKSEPCRSTSYQMNDVDCCSKNIGYGEIGDNYLADEVLMESGNKVAFDGYSRNYLAFHHGMKRIMPMYGKQYSLIYNVLQSRCERKASEAIKCCNRI